MTYLGTSLLELSSPHKLIVGTVNIAKALDIQVRSAYIALKTGVVPGAFRQPTATGGRDTWVLPEHLAKHYAEVRKQTPKYVPANVTKRLLLGLGRGKYQSIPELMDAGLLTDLLWCQALNEERKRCHMDNPILMHPKDFSTWANDRMEQRKKQNRRLNTEAIFAPIRRNE
jgi:hypothetical protein